VIESSDLSDIPQDLIDHLQRMYPPVTNTLAHDLRFMDHRSGQISVVEYLSILKKRQTNAVRQ
jgi:hypothetical protein